MTTDPDNGEGLVAIRKRAWETRRAKYGPRGHGGGYGRGPGERGALRLVILMMNEGLLSEGQVSKATGLDRVTIRMLADDALQQPGRVGPIL